MTNAELLAKIKAEIERRIHNIENCPFIEAEFGASEKRDGKLTAYKELLSFISTIEKLEKSVPKDLEEAADKYEKENTGIYPEVGQTSIRDAFIDGYNLCREQMMKVAVNGWLDEDNEPPYDLNVVCEEKIPFGKFKHGDKVKLIIIKED